MISAVLTVLFIAFLEGILSLDNALVLGVMVKDLHPAQRKKALAYGIWGAFIFRFISLFFLSHLIEMPWIRVVGGAYLLYVAAKGLTGEEDQKGYTKSCHTLWRTVLAVELVDISFSIDSILASVSLSRSYWVIFFGAVFGIIMMRFAATVFVRLFQWFPGLNRTAFILVAIIGAKLTIEGFNVPWIDFHSAANPASWVFWVAMVATITGGFSRKRELA